MTSLQDPIVSSWPLMDCSGNAGMGCCFWIISGQEDQQGGGGRYAVTAMVFDVFCTPSCVNME